MCDVTCKIFDIHFAECASHWSWSSTSGKNLMSYRRIGEKFWNLRKIHFSYDINLLAGKSSQWERWWGCHLLWIQESFGALLLMRYEIQNTPHVLVHLLKSLRAYIVKSSSTLFSDNIQWNLEISFSYARFNSLLGYNFLTESWDHQEWDFSNSCILKLKNPLSNVIYCFEKH